MTSFLRHISLDRAAATLVVTGCMATVLDARMQGRAPLQGEIPAREYPISSKEHTVDSKRLTSRQCRQLEQDGYLILDHFLTPPQIQQARTSIAHLDEHRQFQSSPNEREHIDHPTRTTDRVLICRETTGPLDIVRKQIAALARGVVDDSDFDGFDGDTYQPANLHVPAQMQVSICNGVQASEGVQESETKSTHNFYHVHLDTAGADLLGELGWVGWLKSHHLRQRYLSCILYLNDDWKEEDGGCLRLFQKGSDPRLLDTNQYIDVPPLAGRLVLFSSLDQWHVVLPTQVTRYACSMWLSLKN